MIAKMFRKAGPNEAIMVYGFRGPRVVKGHGTVIFPMVESFRQLSLELMSFDVAPQQDLDQKLGETRSRCELLMAPERRTRMVSKATAARQTMRAQQSSPAIDRMKSRILGRESRNEAEVELLGGDALEDRFAALDREEQVETLLKELKAKQARPA